MDDENVYLEDTMEATAGSCLDQADKFTPGSDEHVACTNEAIKLIDARERVTEVELKFESENAQRKHEMALKRMEYDLKDRELNIRAAELAEQRRANTMDTVCRGADIGVKALGAAGVIAVMVANLKAEYVDMTTVTSGPWRWAQGIVGRMFHF